MAFIVKTFFGLKTLSSSSVLPHLAYCQQGYSNPSGIILWTRRHSSKSLAYCEQGKKKTIEILWQQFFLDPSQWWDHRSEKENARFPDFKHSHTKQALWVVDNLNPPWVKTKLAAMAPGTVRSSIFSWNRRLARFVKSCDYEKTLESFQQMQHEGLNPDKFTFVPVLNACAGLQALEQGRKIHSQVIQLGFESDVHVGTGLVNMYAKCGSINEALRVFNEMSQRDTAFFNVMMLGYVKCEEGQKALELFRQMQQEGVDPDRVSFIAMLNACASTGDLEEGRRVHEQVTHTGCESDVYVGNSLIDMYSKCGSIEDAWRVFKGMPTRNVVSWSAIIMGYVKFGDGQKALQLSQQMKLDVVELDRIAYLAVLNACILSEALKEGRDFHEQIIEMGYDSNMSIANSLLELYSKCGSTGDAWRVFDKIASIGTPDVHAWNAMILLHLNCGQGQKALEIYQAMGQEGVDPDSLSFVRVLNACACVLDLKEGKKIHQQLLQSGCESNVFVASSLVDMYAKCGSIDDAHSVFEKMPARDVVAWSSMIMGYVKCGKGQEALKLFWQMQEEGVKANPVAFVAVLNACACAMALDDGRHIHKQIIQSGFESNEFVGSSLVNMYAKCGSIEDAESVFNMMSRGDVVSWSAMIAGYAVHGHAKEALEFFERMCKEGVEINNVTFISLLSACSHGGLVTEGLHCLESMSRVYGISPGVDHYSCIIDLLGRAGLLHEAEDLIKTMAYEPNITVWMSMLGGCRIHGNVEMAEHAAKNVLELDPTNSAGSVLLSNIYIATGK